MCVGLLWGYFSPTPLTLYEHGEDELIVVVDVGVRDIMQ